MVSRRKSTTFSSGGGTSDYEVGYGKPPRHAQFRPGQSGNPAGRPKGVRNLKTDVKRTLAAPVKVTKDGRTRKKSTQEAALMVLLQKALGGDPRALDRLFDLAVRFNNDSAEAGPAQPLPADDRAIVDAYAAEVVAAAKAEPTASPDVAPNPRAGKGRKAPK
jgi:Family of unknown function (DUF5681)